MLWWHPPPRRRGPIRTDVTPRESYTRPASASLRTPPEARSARPRVGVCACSQTTSTPADSCTERTVLARGSRRTRLASWTSSNRSALPTAPTRSVDSSLERRIGEWREIRLVFCSCCAEEYLPSMTDERSRGCLIRAQGGVPSSAAPLQLSLSAPRSFYTGGGDVCVYKQRAACMLRAC